jgi:hypothetical protein
MAPVSPIPQPYKWGKWLVRIVDWTPIGWVLDQFDSEDQAPVGAQWRQLKIRFTGIAPGWDVADDAYITFDIVNLTNGEQDDTWTDADFVTCEGKFRSFCTSMQPATWSGLKVSEFRWYRRAFTPLGDPNPFEDSGPPVRVLQENNAGTATTSVQAPQVALSFTERTPIPKNWGRFYWPGFCHDLTEGNRQLTVATTDLYMTYFRTLYEGLADADFPIVVPSTMQSGQPARGLLNVTSLQVDSILDVIRRRRPRNPVHRSIQP